MTSANRILDEALGGEDGVSPIRFGRHDADQVLGHLQNHATRESHDQHALDIASGMHECAPDCPPRVLRVHRRSGLVLDLPEPYEHDVWATVREVVAGVLVMGGLFIGILTWVAIAAASQVTP